MATVRDLSGNNGTVDTAVSLADSQLTTLATKLDALDTSVDAVNTSVATTNTKLDTVNTSVGTVNTSVGTVNTSVGTGNTALTTLNTSVNSVYPVGATPLTATSGNVANAEAVATLAGATDKTTYVTGLSITGGGATQGSVVLATLAGIISGTQTFPYAVAAGVLVGNQEFGLTFDPPIPASAVNTAIVLTLPALGAGNTNAAVNLTGYRL